MKWNRLIMLVAMCLMLFVGIAVADTTKASTNDSDGDGWDNAVEQTIHKYYSDFDPINETPTKNDIVKAVTNAVTLYFMTDDIEERREIYNDVIVLVTAYINAYFGVS